MDPSLLKRLWPVFVEEAREHLQEIGSGILELEKGTAREGLLQSIRRTAHGLKGSASSLGFTDLERLAHAMESALAGKTEKDGLESGRVEALLAAVDAGEAALRQGDAGKAPEVPQLAQLLGALQGASLPPAAAKPGAAAPASATEQVWPVFRAEAGEHLARLRQTLGAARPGAALDAPDADALARIAKNLRSSAALLGARAMESAAARLQDQLAAAATPTAAQLEELLATAAQLEASLGPAPALAAEAPAAEAAHAERSDPSLVGIFRREAGEAVAALEEGLKQLCSPSADDRRAQLVEDAVRRAHNLKGSAGAVGASEIAERAARLQGTLARMAVPGLEASRAAASAAEDIVGLRAAAAAFGRVAEPAEKEPEPRPAPEHHAAADRTIRVSVHTLESVARQVESFTLLRAREERRAREVTSQGAALTEVRQLCQRVLEEIRHAQLEADEPQVLLDDALARLRGAERALARMGQEQLREAEQIRLVSTVVREDLRDLRMVPAATAIEPLRRTVREVAGRLGKQVELTLRGGEVRLDRRILDELKDPLQHLVRNAIDHGLERPEERKAAGKAAAGALEVRVERRGHRIAVVVADDGAGLSAETVRRVAVRRGLIGPQDALVMTDDEALRLIFRPGFSTTEQVTEISGRGVGLDVVQAAAHKLRGTVDLSTARGEGTRFTLDLPLTLAATLAVVVRAGPDFAALPYETVERILRVSARDLGTVAGRATVRVEDAQVPFAALSQVVGGEPGRLPAEGERPLPAVLINTGGTRMAFAVDEVAGQHEVVVQSLGKHLARTAHLAGAAALEDGRVVSVLNVPELVRLARPLSRGAASSDQRPRVVVVDDSLTTRSAMKAVLEIAGYQVLPASDGEEALALLRQTPCQLVVSDVQMPRMDGLTLTRRIKSDRALAAMPVVLVTSLDSPADRAAGLEAGADGYLVKRDVERGRLLELVRQLMPVVGTERA